MQLDRSPVRLSLSALAVVTVCLLSACSHGDSIRPVTVESQKSSLRSQETPGDRARPFLQLGQKYMELGKLELAKDNLLKALNYDPKSVDAHTLLATLYDRVGDSGQALQHYRDAALLAPKAGAENN